MAKHQYSRKRRNQAVFAGLLAGLVLATSPVSRAETIFVAPNGSGDYPTIQAAIMGANAGDTVLLADGVFRGEGNRDLLINKNITVRSQSGDPNACIIDCEGSPHDASRGFDFSGVDAAIVEGLTVRNGWHGGGGAVRSWFSSPTLRNCVFEDNIALQAGAMCFAQGAPTIEGCVLVRNTATQFPAGALFCDNSDLTIRSSTVVGNSSGIDSSGPRFAGGIASMFGSVVRIEQSVIAYSSRGEAVYCDEISSALVSCTNIFGNAGGDWVGCIEDQLGMNQNFHLAPMFCSVDQGDYTLQVGSPCAPPGATGCGLVGALPVACDALPIARSSFGGIKSRYRR